MVASLDVLTIVDKVREIFFIENVKFHIDKVEGLGTFMEIEAIDRDRSIGNDKLHAQCRHFLQELNIAQDCLINCSYSDLLLQKIKYQLRNQENTYSSLGFAWP